MIIKIVEKLKTGSVKNVDRFGISRIMTAPYTIVKPESRSDGTRAFRIIAHFPVDNTIELEDYVFGEVRTLLDNLSVTDHNGNHNAIYTNGEYSDIITGNDDGTIAMEIVYLMPQKLTI